MPTVVQLPAGKALTVRTAADAFLDSLGNLNTVRNYGIGVGKTAEQLGEDRPLAVVADDEVGGVLERLWGKASVNTWTPGGRRCCRGWAGVPSAGTTGRGCRRGRSGCRRRTRRHPPARRWRSTG